MEISLASFKARFTYDPQKDLLGKGGYSEVYKAYDNDYKTDVALKIYQGDYSSQYNLLNEIRKYRRLQHPHVIQHLEAFEVNTGNQDLHGNTIKYQVGILEYANAGTLADLIKQGKLKGPANEAKLESIAKDIISGLEYLHSQNIIHRDLKPSNILLFKQGEKLVPKICDFGIAKVMDNATAVSTQLVGTVEYMAPEYFRTDLGDIGKASDLWSLGVILLEAASGQHPFGKASEGYSNGQIINNILSKEKINIDVIQDASILEIVRCLLIPNPQDRHFKNIGTERKNQSEPIKNPAETNPEPKAVSNNKFWNAMKHLFYSFIDFKFTDGGWKKLLLREFCLILLVLLLTLCLKTTSLYNYKTCGDFSLHLSFYLLNTKSFLYPLVTGLFGENFLKGKSIIEIDSKILLGLFISYTFIQIRIIFYWKKSGYLKRMISKWNYFEINNGKWRGALAKEFIYIIFMAYLTILIGGMIIIFNFFISYSQIQKQRPKYLMMNLEKDSLQEIYERPQAFTSSYFGSDNTEEQLCYTDIGAVYDNLLIKGGFGIDDLPIGLYRNMEYTAFYSKLIEKIDVNRDDVWINKMQNDIRIHWGEGWKNFDLLKAYKSINNFSIKIVPINTADPALLSKILYPYSFKSSYFIDQLRSQVDNDEWLSWFYENRVMKNQRFLDYLKYKGITDRFALRSYVKNKLYVSEHPYADFHNAKDRLYDARIKYHTLFYNVMYINLDEFVNIPKGITRPLYERFIAITFVTWVIFLILLYPLRLIIIILKWIVDNSK